MNVLNAQKLCVFSFTLADQCVSSTPVNYLTLLAHSFTARFVEAGGSASKPLKHC
jgi:hypothetical protein